MSSTIDILPTPKEIGQQNSRMKAYKFVATDYISYQYGKTADEARINFYGHSYRIETYKKIATVARWLHQMIQEKESVVKEKKEEKPPVNEHKHITLHFKVDAPSQPLKGERCESSYWWFVKAIEAEEQVLRDFRRNNREWPMCCGEECEIVRYLTTNKVSIRCKHYLETIE